MSKRFEIIAAPISGLYILQRKPIGDNRGYLERLFSAEELQSVIQGKHIVQINHTLTSRRGTVRGMHFQHPPHAEVKLVSCLRGEVFDVAVDLRHGSESFLQSHGEILSATNHKTFVIPEGFAHGFQTLTADCEMLYFHTHTYQPDAEGGVCHDDPRLAITWPLPITEISQRDTSHPSISSDFHGINL